jgi:hypothetical protein
MVWLRIAVPSCHYGSLTSARTGAASRHKGIIGCHDTGCCSSDYLPPSRLPQVDAEAARTATITTHQSPTAIAMPAAAIVPAPPAVATRTRGIRRKSTLSNRPWVIRICRTPAIKTRKAPTIRNLGMRGRRQRLAGAVAHFSWRLNALLAIKNLWVKRIFRLPRLKLRSIAN